MWGRESPRGREELGAGGAQSLGPEVELGVGGSEALALAAEMLSKASGLADRRAAFFPPEGRALRPPPLPPRPTRASAASPRMAAQ